MKKITGSNYLTLLKKAAVFSVLCLAIFALAAGSVSAKGKRYGLFVGINDYPGADMDLKGAVNDAKNMKSLLAAKFGFLAANTTLLTDSNATRANILNKLAAYGLLAHAGDMLVFQYSGHGTLFPDKYSEIVDETEKVSVDADLGGGERYVVPLDFYDSAIVPWDVSGKTSGKPWGNMILDDELYAVFAPLTKKGVTVIFISDSCHSGTVGKGIIKGKVRFMPPEKALRVKSLADLKLQAPKNQKSVVSQTMAGTYLALSAAKDNEFAMDSSGGTIPNGLFTATLIDVIKASKTPLTYKRLMALVQPKVAATSMNSFDNDQHPQLDGRFGNVDTPLFAPFVK